MGPPRIIFKISWHFGIGVTEHLRPKIGYLGTSVITWQIRQLLTFPSSIANLNSEAILQGKWCEYHHFRIQDQDEQFTREYVVRNNNPLTSDLDWKAEQHFSSFYFYYYLLCDYLERRRSSYQFRECLFMCKTHTTNLSIGNCILQITFSRAFLEFHSCQHPYKYPANLKKSYPDFF